MNILITNDDGFDAEGILALTEALTGLGRLLIVAPTENKSGASSSLSLHKDIVVYPAICRPICGGRHAR